MDEIPQKSSSNDEIDTCRTWIFFEEIKQKKTLFEIVAKNHKEAYEMATKKYGARVKNLYYCIK